MSSNGNHVGSSNLAKTEETYSSKPAKKNPTASNTEISDDVSRLIAAMRESKKTAQYAETIKLLNKFERCFDNPESDDYYRKKIGDEMAEEEQGNEGFLVDYMNYLTSDGSKYPLNKEESKYKCYIGLRRVCWNYTDSSTRLCEELGKNNLISLLLDDLKEFQNTYDKSEERRMIVRSAIGILHNCAVVRGNVKYFKDSEGSRLVKWYVKKTKEDLQDGLGISFIMTYSNIFDDDDDEIMADNFIIKILLKLLEEALQNDGHRSTSHHSYHAIDIMKSLTKLAGNQKISTSLVKEGILHKIYKMLIHGDEKEKTVAAEAAWVLAFTDDNKNMILREVRLVELLETYSSTKSQGDLSDLEWSCTMALRVLQMPKKSSAKVLLASNQRPAGDHVMISYNWKYQKIALQVRDRLKANNYNIWMDVDKMSGSILGSMADAIEKASIVLVCLSQEYKDSKNCRTEGEYIYQCGVPIIPVVVENRYKADGWLGALIGTKLYYNLSDNRKFKKHFPGLLKELATSSTASQDGKTDPENKDPSKTKQLSASDWTAEEVEKWLKENSIEKLKEMDLDGETLLFLKNTKNQAPEFFFRCITEKLGLQDLRNIMRFSKAIDSIR